jgi:hypothetical protein
MISTELSNVADWCLGWAAQGRSMPPREAGHLAKVLLDLSHQVAHLERLPIDDECLAPLEVVNG